VGNDFHRVFTIIDIRVMTMNQENRGIKYGGSIHACTQDGCGASVIDIVLVMKPVFPRIIFHLTQQE
jgi:hypothetical protein